MPDLTVSNDIDALMQAANDAAARGELGATTVGAAIFLATNPSAITFLRVNADNTVTLLSAADFRTALALTALATTTPGTDVATALAIAAIGASGGLVRGTGATLTTATLSGIRTLTGAKVTTASAMGALAIDVTQGFNTKSISGDSTFTFSGTPGTTNQWFGMFVTNTDGSAHTLTIPSSFSIARAGAITSIIIPANGKLMLVWNYDGSVYNLYGDPPLVSGTGSFALTTSPTFVTPVLGTPASGNLAACTGYPVDNLAGGQFSQNVTLGTSTGQLYLAGALADGEFSGISITGTAGATLAFGDLVYLAAADSRWELADASSVTTAGDVKLGICVLAAAADGDPTEILRFGNIRANAAFPAMTISAPMFVSETAGDITGTKPTTTDSVTRCVGHANTADELEFNPDGFYITHV